MEGDGAAFDAKVAFGWLGAILLTLVGVALVWYGGTFLLLTFAGILVAVLLRAPTGFLVRRAHLPDRLAYVLVLIAVTGMLVAFGFYVGPRLIQQAGEFSSQVPGFVEDARDWLQERPWGSWLVERIDGATGVGGDQGGGPAGAPGEQQGPAQAQQSQQPAGAAGTQGQAPQGQGGTQSGGNGGASGILSTAAGLLRSLGVTFAHFAYVIVIGLFLGVNPHLYRAGLVRLFPARSQERVAQVVDELGTTLKYWLMGQLALMVITGILTGIGLVILGVPLALGLAFFVGLMDFVPFIGPIIGFIPVLLVAAAQGGSTLLWALILYVAVQQLEGNILVPLIQQRAVSLPPALTIAAVFLGGALFGLLGAILATPLVAVIFVLVKMVYVHDVLGQRVEVPGGEESAPA